MVLQPRTNKATVRDSAPPPRSPDQINCWPEEESKGKILVSIEYEAQGERELQNVNIQIPLGTADAPQISAIDGTFRHDPREHRMLWNLDIVDASNAGGRWGGRGYDTKCLKAHQGGKHYGLGIRYGPGCDRISGHQLLTPRLDSSILHAPRKLPVSHSEASALFRAQPGVHHQRSGHYGVLPHQCVVLVPRPLRRRGHRLRHDR
jgi:hypothetical protein